MDTLFETGLQMSRSFRRLLSLFASAYLALGSVCAMAGGLDSLLPHRAVYDLSLIEASERSGILGMNGRIVYEITGSKCEGFAVRFRFFTEVQTARKSFTNDQRSTSFESGDGRSFTFVNQSYLNGQLEQELRGSAERQGDVTNVALSKPQELEVELGGSIFMNEHVAMLVEAAKNHESFVTAKIFDGSNDGDELVDTTAIIGKVRPEIVELEGEPETVSSQFQDIAGWPVTVSYFTTSGVDGRGEKLPDYQVTFLMHESGVSRDLKMKYSDYALKGDLKNIEFLKLNACD